MCEKAPTDPCPEIPSAPETAIDFGFDRWEAVDEPALDRGLGFGDDGVQKEVAPDHERVVAPREAARPREVVAFGRQADVARKPPVRIVAGENGPTGEARGLARADPSPQPRREMN